MKDCTIRLYQYKCTPIMKGLKEHQTSPGPRGLWLQLPIGTTGMYGPFLGLDRQVPRVRELFENLESLFFFFVSNTSCPTSGVRKQA